MCLPCWYCQHHVLVFLSFSHVVVMCVLDTDSELIQISLIQDLTNLKPHTVNPKNFIHFCVLIVHLFFFIFKFWSRKCIMVLPFCIALYIFMHFSPCPQILNDNEKLWIYGITDIHSYFDVH